MKTLQIATILLLALVAAAQKPLAKTSDTQARLLDITQRLLDAIAPGDKTLWDQYLAGDLVFTGEDGRTLNKRQFLDDLSPLPKGFTGSIKLQNPQVRSTSDMTVISYDLLEHENVLGQELTVYYHATDTWVRRSDKWRMIASQQLRQHADPPVGYVDPAKFGDYVGTYQLSPELRYVVTRSGDYLIGQRTGRKAENLLPETPDVFFRKGVPSRKIFVRDAQGQVTEIRDRLAGVDLVWKRVNAAQPASTGGGANGGKMNHAHGSFDVNLAPQKPDNPVSEAAKLARMTLDKTFHGYLEATSKGEMLSSMGEEVKDSGVYVAIERVTGTLAGRSGSFVLHHTGIMERGQPRLTITVAPDSGTGDLKGISGTMTVTIEPDGKHFYDFAYELPSSTR